MTNRTGGGLLSDCCSQMSREVRMETGWWLLHRHRCQDESSIATSFFSSRYWFDSWSKVIQWPNCDMLVRMGLVGFRAAYISDTSGEIEHGLHTVILHFLCPLILLLRSQTDILINRKIATPNLPLHRYLLPDAGLFPLRPSCSPLPWFHTLRNVDLVEEGTDQGPRYAAFKLIHCILLTGKTIDKCEHDMHMREDIGIFRLSQCTRHDWKGEYLCHIGIRRPQSLASFNRLDNFLSKC